MNAGDDMTMSADKSLALVPAQASGAVALPAIVRRAGPAAVFAAEEFFYGAIRNKNTRVAYKRAVDQFLAWCETKGLELPRITPGDVGHYFDTLREQRLSVATRKQRLAGLRYFFDGMVTRHAIVLNPALSVREERYEVIEGKTPEISVPQARTLFKSLDLSDAVRLRDRAILAILAYT
jgi:site-specific recombinase XerD